MPNRITELFDIEFPIIQAGMVWASGWKLASAVSNAGGLGIIGAGSMYPETLRHHIRKCQAATSRPFAVNVPLLYPEMEEIIHIIIEEGVKIVFTSAGNPRTWTPHLKSHGITVVHVVSSVKFALKAQEAGVDADADLLHVLAGRHVLVGGRVERGAVAVAQPLRQEKQIGAPRKMIIGHDILITYRSCKFCQSYASQVPECFSQEVNG